MCNQASVAIRAAKNRYKWGRYMARRYCEKRGVSHRLYRIACQCEAMSKIGD
jgi:hypothetical protein